MSKTNIMSTTSAEEEPFAKVVTDTSFPLRPLEPSNASVFSDIFTVGNRTSSFNPLIGSLYSKFEINFDELSEEYDSPKGASVPVFNLSSEETFDPRDGIQTTSMTMMIDDEGVIAPPQFPGKL